jgi:hypothetical protein
MEKPAKHKPRYRDHIARTSLVGLGLLLFFASIFFSWQLHRIQSQPAPTPIDLSPINATLATQSQQVATLEKQLHTLQQTITSWSPRSGDHHTLFCIQMAILSLQTQQPTEQAQRWLSRIESANPHLQEAIDKQKKVLAHYHLPNHEPRLKKLQALIQRLQTLESTPTLASATQQENPESIVALPAFLDRYLVIHRQDRAKAQYWLDATRQAITIQEIVGALYVAQLALVAHQERDYQQALEQALVPLQHLQASDIATITPIITALQTPLPEATLPDLYPLYELARQAETPDQKAPITEQPPSYPSPHTPLISEAF